MSAAPTSPTSTGKRRDLLTKTFLQLVIAGADFTPDVEATTTAQNARYNIL